MLLLNHGDFLVEAAAQIGVVEAADVHIVVHGLLLGGGDDGGIELGNGRRRVVVDGTADAAAIKTEAKTLWRLVLRAMRGR